MSQKIFQFSDWTLLNYLNFRQKEDSWTTDKSKEHNWYKRHLRVLTKDLKLSSKALSALEAFKVDHSVIPHHNASDISATVDGPFLYSQVDHSVIPHHNASDISATIDGPIAGHLYLLAVDSCYYIAIHENFLGCLLLIHFLPNKDESISSTVKKFWQDVKDTDRQEKINRKKASAINLEVSMYDILDATRASVVENVKTENKKHNVIHEDGENNLFFISPKRAKLGSNSRDSSSLASSNAKLDSEPLSNGNDLLSKHAKSDITPPSDRSGSSSSASSHAKSVSDGNDSLSKHAKSGSKPPRNRNDLSLKFDGSNST
ncbi:24896_t:CDS:2 [Gigaspora margarita]|uniref:24896_t:CDS:1 n=1 Tax=Gigaspora margarita TaxID=4874 RepID=A0ABN7UMN2_GIGMA|nr:24896_t:CDS:2 [Gigaspora margarita]